VTRDEQAAIQELAQMNDDMASVLVVLIQHVIQDHAGRQDTIQLLREWQDRCQAIIGGLGGVHPLDDTPDMRATGVQS
jgi:transcriptional regulator GlxA family with amidase domain